MCYAERDQGLFSYTVLDQGFAVLCRQGSRFCTSMPARTKVLPRAAQFLSFLLLGLYNQ